MKIMPTVANLLAVISVLPKEPGVASAPLPALASTGGLASKARGVGGKSAPLRQKSLLSRGDEGMAGDKPWLTTKNIVCGTLGVVGGVGGALGGMAAGSAWAEKSGSDEGQRIIVLGVLGSALGGAGTFFGCEAAAYGIEKAIGQAQGTDAPSTTSTTTAGSGVTLTPASSTDVDAATTMPTSSATSGPQSSDAPSLTSSSPTDAPISLVTATPSAVPTST